MAKLPVMESQGRVRIKEGWGDAGKEGDFYCLINVGTQLWAIVLWDGDEDPDCFKAQALEIPETKWRTLL